MNSWLELKRRQGATVEAVLAESDDVPLLVFDEVEANVGGEIGRVVGERMADIAERHQVLCVTHLPQVAAQARSHLLVTKDQSGARATVEIEPIHGEPKARIGELARMLGDRSAKSALAHAEELLRGYGTRVPSGRKAPPTGAVADF